MRRPIGTNLRKLQGVVQRQFERAGFRIARNPRPDLGLYGDYPAESLRMRRFYNVGAGQFRHPYWTNVDHGTQYYSDKQTPAFVEHDLMTLKPLPVDAGVAEAVYSSHALEHVSNAAVANLLREAYRILKPRGVLRLTMPDAELAFQAYRRQDRRFWYWADWYSAEGTWEHLYRVPLSQASIPNLFLHQFASQLCEIDVDDTAIAKYGDAQIDEAFATRGLQPALDFFTQQCVYNPERPGNHMNWFTHDKLSAMLGEVGFVEVKRSGYGQATCAPLRDVALFDNTHPAISLYVEARKTPGIGARG